MSYFKNPTILKILEQYKDLWALSYVGGVTHWDLETYMPQKGAATRGEAMARVSTIRQKLFLDKEFVNLIHKAERIKDLNDYEKGVVRILIKSLKFYEKLPPKFLEEFEKTTSTATVVWRDAKAKDEYKLFEPHLKKIFDLNRKMADYLGFKDSPYDALLDLYEEDLKSKGVEDFFGQVISPLKMLLKGITNSPRYQNDHYLEHAKYDKEKLIALNNKVLKDFWGEYGANFRLDVSSHPFTTSFGKNDTRITTWYHDTDFGRSLLATIHEFGHALYELQGEDQLQMTPLEGGSSLVIHESQSRFWENHIGRSREFITKYVKDIRQVVGDPKLKTEDVYMYFNKVSPGFLRVEADEVTYHFHIALRFEIEKGIIEGKLKFSDINEVWNSKVKDYLGLKVKKDSQGILQDIHWSGGIVGYFPTYSLGTFLGSQWEEKVGESIKNSNYKKIKDWLRNNIHKYGSTYTLEELLNKRRMVYDPGVNLEYLRHKYSETYNFKAD